MKKTAKTEIIDFNKDDLKTTAITLTEVVKKINELISDVKENEIKDIDWGKELNKTHNELIKLFEFVSVFKSGEEGLIKGLKTSLIKLQGRISTCNDEEEKKKLNRYVDFIKTEIIFFDSSNAELENNKKTITIQSKTEKLKSELQKYGFFDLEMTKNLCNGSSEEIINLLIGKELPYKIAMIDFLGFVRHLEKEHTNTKNDLYKCISEIFNTDIRRVKGNLLVLNPISKENKTRYTAYCHKETVQKDYQKLK